MSLSRKTFTAWVQPIDVANLLPDEADLAATVCQDTQGKFYKVIAFLTIGGSDFSESQARRLGIVRARVSALIEGNQGPNDGKSFEVSELILGEEVEN